MIRSGKAIYKTGFINLDERTVFNRKIIDRKRTIYNRKTADRKTADRKTAKQTVRPSVSPERV